MHTITNMAKALGVERHVVAFLIRDREIKPVGKVGATHIYSRQTFDQIKKILDKRGVTQ